MQVSHFTDISRGKCQRADMIDQQKYFLLNEKEIKYYLIIKSTEGDILLVEIQYWK